MIFPISFARMFHLETNINYANHSFNFSATNHLVTVTAQIRGGFVTETAQISIKSRYGALLQKHPVTIPTNEQAMSIRMDDNCNISYLSQTKCTNIFFIIIKKGKSALIRSLNGL